MDKRTPLYEIQKALGARFVSFGGWELPVSYSDILKEHHAVRNNAGLFDVSHMGEILITGKDSLDFVNKIITNDISKTAFNKIVYSPMCYENGTVVDDILIYKISDTKLLLIVNASNTEKDYEWIKSQRFGDVQIENLSPRYVQLALQGPGAENILRKLVNKNTELPGFFTFSTIDLLGMEVLISRTGYTGEDGFEIYLDTSNPKADPSRLWNEILKAGEDEGLLPAGLGARDTLRLEAALPLYGHELSDTITPLEAGLEKFVKLDKPGFIGREALAEQIQNPKRKLYGFKMNERGIPRNGYEVFINDEKVGYVTSGGPLPTLNVNGGLALLNNTGLMPGDTINIAIRQRHLSAVIVPTPFYKKRYKK
jgi:aminomethyltransferase